MISLLWSLQYAKPKISNNLLSETNKLLSETNDFL
jgi:hypothetical protein